jgi:hypothetical protein
MNAQPLPLPLLEDGLPLPLPTTAGLPDRLPCDGAAAGELANPLLATDDGVAAGGGGGRYVTGAALVGTGTEIDETCELCEPCETGIGTGTEEMCEECETWETCEPVPDT